MTALGLVGLLVGLAAWRIAFVDATKTRMTVFTAVFSVHLTSSVVYFLYAQDNPADANFYYFDPFSFYGRGFEPGTQALIYIVQSGKELFGGTYLDYFIVFQAISLWGMAFLMRSIDEIYSELGSRQPLVSYAVLFLPGLHFWTGAIGKDSPLFLGCSLAAWAAIRLKTRYIALAVAVAIMLLFRPHIALVAVVVLAVSTALDGRVALPAKASLLVLAAAGATLSALTLQTTLGVDVTSAGSVSEFFQANSEIVSKTSGDTAVIGASYPTRLMSLLFKPFFIDANGIFALIASLENLVLAFIISFILIHYRLAGALAKRVLFLRFAVLFSVTLALMLAMVYYNVGLGLRQKTMFMPTLLIFFSAVVAVRRRSTHHEIAHRRVRV